MRIGAFQRFSLLDYPGKIAAIIFTQGCNFRCSYCYNPQLVLSEYFQRPIEEAEVLEFLGTRKDKLQGVVVTGGEPTIQKGLSAFLVQLKSMGFAVKLDTNGSHPEILNSIIDLRLVDFIAMDIKTSLANYEKAIGVKVKIEAIQESIKLIVNSGLPYQFRTTLVKSHCSEDDLKSIQRLVGSAQNHVLQAFLPMPTILHQHVLAQEQYGSQDIQRLKMKYQRGS